MDIENELVKLGFNKVNLELVNLYSKKYKIKFGNDLIIRVDIEEDELTIMNWNTIYEVYDNNNDTLNMLPNIINELIHKLSKEEYNNYKLKTK